LAVSFIGHRNRIPETKIPKSFKIKEVIRSRKSKKDRKRANETSLLSRLLSCFVLTAEICGKNIKEFDRHDDMLFPVFLHVIDHSIYNATLILLLCYTCFSAHACYHRLAESKTFLEKKLSCLGV
jgi:hypothetical protein